MFKKLVIITLSLVLPLTLLAGCAGKTPNPVQVYQPDDEYLNCSQIKEELNNNQAEMYRLYPKTKKLGKNVVLGVTGYFLIVPLFFMDFSDAEKIEIDAFQKRDAHLQQLGEQKGCQKLPPKIKFVNTPPKK